MPAKPPIRLLDTVALVSDIPELGLAAGEVGAVVELLSRSRDGQIIRCGMPPRNANSSTPLASAQ